MEHTAFHAPPAPHRDKLPEASYSILEVKDNLPKEYEAYIYTKWLMSLRYGSKFFKKMESRSYFDSYSKYISRLLKEPNAVVRLAVLSDDPDVVLGFSLSRGAVLDYVYVHKDHRRQGLGKDLLPNNIDTITHLTNVGMMIWQDKSKKIWKFNPFA